MGFLKYDTFLTFAPEKWFFDTEGKKIIKEYEIITG